MSVTVKLTRGEDGKYEVDLGSAALPKISWDPMTLDPEVRKEEHMGARLLVAAALACYVNTLAGDMQRGGADKIGQITATGEVQKERDTNMRTRYTHMEIQVRVPVPEEDQAAFKSVRKNLLNGSLATYSLEEEMDMDYNIESV